MSFLPMHSTSKSTITQVKGTVSTTASEIAVVDAAAFPYAPNFATIGIDTKTEVILYQGVDLSNNKLIGCLRGQSHTTPREWESGNFIYHSQTEDIMNAMVKYIRDLSNQGGGGGTGGVVASGAGAHNAVYRGKWLGNAVTDEQYAAISSGTFDDLYIGDYWTIGDVNYRIAAFDYYYNCGGTTATNCTTHHAVIVPDRALYDAAMNATNSTTGGYVGSLMRTTNLAQAKTMIKAAFSGHVLKHADRLVNATSGGKASGWVWTDSEVELMNEVMVYGSIVWGQATIGSCYNVCSGSSQLPLFALRHDIIYNRQNWWLRDVSDATTFACVSAGGISGYYSAATSFSVRPVFCIS